MFTDEVNFFVVQGVKIIKCTERCLFPYTFFYIIAYIIVLHTLHGKPNLDMIFVVAKYICILKTWHVKHQSGNPAYFLVECLIGPQCGLHRNDFGMEKGCGSSFGFFLHFLAFVFRMQLNDLNTKIQMYLSRSLKTFLSLKRF